MSKARITAILQIKIAARMKDKITGRLHTRITKKPVTARNCYRKYYYLEPVYKVMDRH